MEDNFDFDVFLTSHAAKLTYYCAAMIGHADAEDAAQEAFLRVWQNLHRIPNEIAAVVFLYRTAYRLSVDIMRHRKRRSSAAEEKNVPVSAGLSSEMHHALMQLTPADRAILYSRIMDEEDYSSIALRFGKNEAWARKRYSLARKKLKQILGKEKKYER